MRLLRWLFALFAPFLYRWQTTPDATPRPAHTGAPLPPADPVVADTQHLKAGLDAATRWMARGGNTCLWVESECGTWMLAGFPATIHHAVIAPRPEMMDILLGMSQALEAGDEHGLSIANHKLLVHMGGRLKAHRKVQGAGMAH